jgi:hypothetical protein
MACSAWNQDIASSAVPGWPGLTPGWTGMGAGGSKCGSITIDALRAVCR